MQGVRKGDDERRNGLARAGTLVGIFRSQQTEQSLKMSLSKNEEIAVKFTKQDSVGNTSVSFSHITMPWRNLPRRRIIEHEEKKGQIAQNEVGDTGRTPDCRCEEPSIRFKVNMKQ